MSKLTVLLVILVSFHIEQCSTEKSDEEHTRQKRCIVVQKQSGTHGDSNEGGDGADDDDQEDEEAYRNPKPDKPEAKLPGYTNNYKRNYDIETLPLPPLKYTKANAIRKTNKKYREQKKNSKIQSYKTLAQF